MSNAYGYNALDRARREVARLESEEAARNDPAHEHDWWEYDGSWHCFKCRTTVHENPVGEPQ